MKYLTAMLFWTFTATAPAQVKLSDPPKSPNIHLAGDHLERSAKASSLAMITAVTGGIITGAIAAQADAGDDMTSVAMMGMLTFVGTVSFTIGANSHKRKAGKALKGEL